MKFELLVPITFLIVVMVLVKSLMSYRHKRLVVWHQTLLASMEKGHQLDPDVLRRISKAADPQRSDLKKSILFCSVAFLIGLVSVVAPVQDEQGRVVLRIIACIPLGFSLLYLGFWKFWYK